MHDQHFDDVFSVSRSVGGWCARWSGAGGQTEARRRCLLACFSSVLDPNQGRLFHAQVQLANQASISLEIFAQQRAELFWGARLGCERKAKQVLA